MRFSALSHAAAFCTTTALFYSYEYDAKKIKQFYGKIDRFYAPGENTGGETHGVGWGARNYHGGNGNGPAKQAGENTDYGDYNLLILEHLAATTTHDNDKKQPTTPQLELNTLIPRWQEKLKTWRSWMCTQTKKTLQQVRSGVPFDRLGGPSNAMAIRFAPVFAFFADEKSVVKAAHTAMFTHRETTAHQGAEFFARVAYRLIHSGSAGLTPIQAIQQVAAESPAFIQQKVAQALEKIKEATDSTTSLSQEEFVDDLALTSMARLWDVGKTEPIKVGKASPTEGTLPGSIYFIVKYEDDLAGALRANAEVGGDSASRAIAIGMTLGAYLGQEAIPAEWGAGHLVEWEHSTALLEQAPLLAGKASAAVDSKEL